MQYTNETQGRQKVYPTENGTPHFLEPGESIECDLPEGVEPRVLDVAPEPEQADDGD